MIPAANRFTAVLDACVLYPNMKRDLLLRFFEADLYRARWSEEIIQECFGNLRINRADLENRINRTEALIREHFQDAWVTGYESLIPGIVLPDPDDRHVVAAALRTHAQYIVTDNIKDFPGKVLAEFDLECGTADMFLAGTFEHYEMNAMAVIRSHRAGLKSKPSPSEYVMTLIQGQMPLLAARIKPYMQAI